MLEKIPEKVQEASMECPTRFCGTFKEISRNFQKDPEECFKRIEEMIKKILENVTKDFQECSRGFWGSKYGIIS